MAAAGPPVPEEEEEEKGEDLVWENLNRLLDYVFEVCARNKTLLDRSRLSSEDRDTLEQELQEVHLDLLRILHKMFRRSQAPSTLEEKLQEHVQFLQRMSRQLAFCPLLAAPTSDPLE